jgi:putative intracellular protease/amidase
MCMTDRRGFLRHSLLAASAVGVSGAWPGAASAQTSPGRKYICPPCGCSMDGTEFDKLGRCPACGMELIEKPVGGARFRPKVAILVFERVQIIDFAGPYEVFGTAGYDVFTVGPSKTPIDTAMGLRITPRYDFTDSPQAEVLLVPGGGISSLQRDRERATEWLQATSAKAKYTLSVCNGSFILADVGLLNGRSATTTYGNLDRLRASYPQVKVTPEVRLTDNGSVLTSAGLSAGIDGALYVVEQFAGRGGAQMVALAMEYDWRPGAFVRANLADTHLHPIFGRLLQLKLPGDATQQVLSTQGDTSSWEIVWKVTGKVSGRALTAAELASAIGSAITAQGSWQTMESDQSGRWQFADAKGDRWTAQLDVDTVASDALDARLSLRKRA